jgi:hypothetical protein
VAHVTATLAVRVHPPALPRAFPRDHLRHWTDQDWQRIPITQVPIADLVPSQSDLSLARLAELVNDPGEYEAGRAVLHDGVHNLYDGHHHWWVALMRGHTHFPVRVVDGTGCPVL